MKRSISIRPQSLMLSLVLALPLLVTAQSVIQRAAVPYLAQPEIKFAIGAPIVVAAPAVPAVAVATPVPAPETPRPIQTWAIEATDARLVDTFSRWTRKAGIQLRWDAARHVEIGAIDTYDGDIEQAMIAALSSPSISNSDHPLEVCFYPNRPVLARVTRRGEQWRDCPLIQAPVQAATANVISSISK